MLDIDRASLAVAISDNGFPTQFFEQLINGIIDRIAGDIYLGSGAPAAGLGEDGDTYLDLNGLAFYTKSSSTWSGSTALDNNTNTLKLSIES